MALILNIETATTNCSVSLSKDGETLVLKEDYNSSYSHAETLHVYISNIFKEANISKNQLDAVAVSKGPGSYTGLRIGVSAAKGICFALDVPLISVSTLKSLATQVEIDEGCIVPMLDARRMEVYSAIYSFNYELKRDIQAQIITTESFKQELELSPLYFIGSGVEKTEGLIKHKNAFFIDNKLPSAAQMAQLSEEKYQTSDFEDVAYFEPYYLKDFIGVKTKS